MVDEATPLTHLQVQKLLYYAQGWCLALHDRPLFDGTVEAWRHGPVVRELFPKFADYEGKPIPWSEARDDDALTQDDRSVVEYVWQNYGRFSPWHLREMTHREPPWRNARAGMPDSAVSRAPISPEAMKSFFHGLNQSRGERIDASQIAESVRQARNGRTSPFVG